jgi:hypothetical protein
MSSNSLSVKGLPLGYVFYEQHPVWYTKEMQYEISLIKYTSEELSTDKVDLQKGRLIKLDDRVIYVF